MRQIEVNGERLEVVECGDGADLVLVHGSASDRRTWGGQLEHWCEAFRVITYSRRYHWPNRRLREGGTYALDEHVADLRALLGKLDAAPAALVGHSYGGVIGLVLAANAPELVDALVLGEPPVLGLFGRVPPSPLQLLGLALRRPRTALGIARLGARGLGPAAAALERGDEEEAMRRMGTAILGKRAFRELSDRRVEQIRDNLIPEEITGEDALPRLDPSSFASIRCPVLVLEGERSPAIFSHLLDRLEELLPDVERATIPDASHMLHEDNPSAFHRAVEAFLA